MLRPARLALPPGVAFCGAGTNRLCALQNPAYRPARQFIFSACAKTAGLPPEKRHPHVLKHSLASHLVAGNVNLAFIRQALGHRSINSTIPYFGTSDGQAAEAVQAALMRLY